MTLNSRGGVGTNVELWLPISATISEGDIAPSNSTPMSADRGVVLLVDDEEVVRASTADMLEELGYEVLEAASGEAGLTLVAQGAIPALLLTDHIMPGMSGVELAPTMRTTLPDLPVLIVSGYADVEDLSPGLARLTKPFRSAELAACLAQITISNRET